MKPHATTGKVATIDLMLGTITTGGNFVYAGAGDDTMSLLFLSGEQTTVYGDGGNDFLSTFETDEIDTIRVYSVENWSK